MVRRRAVDGSSDSMVQERGNDRGDRTADRGEHEADPVQREVAWSQGRAGERHVVEQRSEGEEEGKADGDARHRRRLTRRNS
jgi:hypothetical protein